MAEAVAKAWGDSIKSPYIETSAKVAAPSRARAPPRPAPPR